MNLVDAFLTISGLAYFCALYYRCTWNLEVWEEKSLFLALGSAILLTVLFFPNRNAFIAMSAFYVTASLGSWYEETEWRTKHLLKEEGKMISHTHQVAMFAWDLLIALCFMMKV